MKYNNNEHSLGEKKKKHKQTGFKQLIGSLKKTRWTGQGEEVETGFYRGRGGVDMTEAGKVRAMTVERNAGTKGCGDRNEREYKSTKPFRVNI